MYLKMKYEHWKTFQTWHNTDVGIWRKYILHFRYKSTSWCFYLKVCLLLLLFTFSIDATKTDAIAKMVNDGVGETANCIVKKKMFNGLPFLCMFALRDIGEGEELRYDYGQPDLPWRQKVSDQRMQSSIVALNMWLPYNFHTCYKLEEELSQCVKLQTDASTFLHAWQTGWNLGGGRWGVNKLMWDLAD